jgi:23S rRNA G2445 N2-methylase RlmL
LASELTALGHQITKEQHNGVEIEGTLRDCIKLNLYLRTGHRVLYKINTFTAQNPEELYKGAYNIPWENYMMEGVTFTIDSFVNNITINDTRFSRLKFKDAIADRFIANKGSRPNSGNSKENFVIYFHWQEDIVSVYIDTSGETISKHGYRKIPGKAPLLESLAASIIYATGWDRKSTFVNPMCGSGTLAIEAALMAANIPPGILRDNYGFMYVKGYDLENTDALEEEVEKNRRAINFKIIASDISEDAIHAAKINAKLAGVDEYIDFYVCDFRKTPIPEDKGIIILNPEYGQRLGETAALEKTYEAIGDFFKKKCQGYKGYIFTGNQSLGKKIGLKTNRRIEFFNAKIECRLLEYELYGGTKKIRPAAD